MEGERGLVFRERSSIFNKRFDFVFLFFHFLDRKGMELQESNVISEHLQTKTSSMEEQLKNKNQHIADLEVILKKELEQMI